MNIFSTKHKILILIPKRNRSGGRAGGLFVYILVKPEVTGSIPSVSLKFKIVRIFISACLVKQPNGTLSRMYVQTYIRVK